MSFCRWLFINNKCLFEELEGRKTLACGTVRSNKVGLPKDICDLKAKEVKSLKRGESLHRPKDTLTRVTWRDRKPVTVLGTVPTSEDDSGVVERSTKWLLGKTELCPPRFD